MLQEYYEEGLNTFVLYQEFATLSLAVKKLAQVCRAGLTGWVLVPYLLDARHKYAAAQGRAAYLRQLGLLNKLCILSNSYFIFKLAQVCRAGIAGWVLVPCRMMPGAYLRQYQVSLQDQVCRASVAGKVLVPGLPVPGTSTLQHRAWRHTCANLDR